MIDQTTYEYSSSDGYQVLYELNPTKNSVESYLYLLRVSFLNQLITDVLANTGDSRAFISQNRVFIKNNDASTESIDIQTQYANQYGVYQYTITNGKVNMCAKGEEALVLQIAAFNNYNWTVTDLTDYLANQDNQRPIIYW